MSSFFQTYSFVDTVLPRTHPSFPEIVNKEYAITEKIRSAVSYCKTLNGITVRDISKISGSDKLLIEDCLQKNFLSQDSEYFGKRDTIFIDLN